MVGLILFILFVVLAVAVVKAVKYAAQKIDEIPAQSGGARVISKRKSRKVIDGGMEYYITFEMAQGPVELRVHNGAFASISEGDEGLLTYKGDLIVDFQKYM